ncbi:Tetraspanin-7 [Dendrobium catenatum]|uniref:Tetraspanin-7 n=1 Tax=Dendrobium catenatum TaxID=906689 RepID=A0A2I0VT04_9ASPA|nr:Tetraspanin-7 [Dendrobium catenatum]
MNAFLFFQEGDNAVQQQPDRVAQCHCLPALSISIFGAGIWLKTGSSTDFEKLLDLPVIVIGVYLMIVSLAGLFSGRCLVSRLIYEGIGEVVSRREYK